MVGGNPVVPRRMDGAGRRRASHPANILDNHRTGLTSHPTSGTNTGGPAGNTQRKSQPSMRYPILTDPRGLQRRIMSLSPLLTGLPLPSEEPTLWAGLIWLRPTALARLPGAPRTTTCSGFLPRNRRLVGHLELSPASYVWTTTRHPTRR